MERGSNLVGSQGQMVRYLLSPKGVEMDKIRLGCTKPRQKYLIVVQNVGFVWEGYGESVPLPYEK